MSRRGLYLVLALSALAGTARAIPPFARRYGVSCGVCHVAGPTKLSEFGEAFRDNGYRFPDDDAGFLREQPIPLGDPSRASLFPRATWPGELPASAPIGVGSIVGGTANIPATATGQAASLVLRADALALFGGSLGEHITFFGTVSAGTSGFAAPQLFVVWRSLFARWLGEAALNLKTGRMFPDLFAVQPNLGRGAIAPLPLTLGVGRDGFFLAAPQIAIEAYGLVAGRLKWVIGVANGEKPTDDFSTRRDLFARVSVKLGGPRLDYAGRPPADSAAPTVSLGAAAYWGVGVVVPSPPEPRFRSDILRLLADARLRVRGLDLLAQVVLGRDTDPDGLAREVRHLAWSAGAEYALLPWLQVHARFEEARFDEASHASHRRVVTGACLFIRPNVRTRVEGAVGLTDAEPSLLVVDLLVAI